MTYALTSAAVGITAAAGARAVDPDSAWYRGLAKPPWQPSPKAFGVIWMPLYASIAWAGGPDPEPYIKAIGAYQEAGFDEVYLGQVGGRLEGAFDFLATQVLPEVREPDLSRCSVLL